MTELIQLGAIQAEQSSIHRASQKLLAITVLIDPTQIRFHTVISPKLKPRIIKATTTDNSMLSLDKCKINYKKANAKG